jgi:HPr kinase/phosphorylase
MVKKRCQDEIKKILKKFFVKKIVTPGGLLQIYDFGILIVGDSGVGKSESALELVSRGHCFVSDDVTQIERTVDKRLIGSAPSLSRNFMEIRGLSIINIKQIFGSKAICKQSEISLVINLKKWEHGKKYDRLGLESPEAYEILGVKLPHISIPVAPGRNIATLIEVACKVHILREKGYHAPQEIADRLDQALSLR